MAAPEVLWAIQSPTLLNRLVSPTVWDLQVADMGDSTGFKEIDLLKAPPWDGFRSDVEWVFVCSPSQHAWALENVPAARIVQVLHQGYRFRAPVGNRLDRAVVFSLANLRQQKTWFPSAAIARLCPSFHVDPVWQWRPMDTWTVLSRPSQRHPMASAGVQEILHLLGPSKPKHTWFGQEQPGGFLNAAQLEAKHRSCSCYLSMLPPASGMGLSEHECMARGVPVVGSMPDVTAQNIRNFWEFESIKDDVLRCCEDEGYACLSSHSGLQYIQEHCSDSHRDASIREMLDLLA